MSLYQYIPQELKVLDRWVNTCTNSKTPMRSYAPYTASTSDPFTWSEYDEAIQALEGDSPYTGIGFVFANDGYVGIDLDHMVTNRIPNSLASKIIKKFNSYTEYSVSGNGIHIFVKGTLPFKGKNNRRGIEIYKDKRFFVMTGDVLLDTPIQENQPAIDWLLEEHFSDLLTENPYDGGDLIYSPYWIDDLTNIVIAPTYPPIDEGIRHLSLVSLAGSLVQAGCSNEYIHHEVRVCNDQACSPPLGDDEINQIINSVTRYRR